MSSDPFDSIINDLSSGVASIFAVLIMVAMILYAFLLIAFAWFIISAGIAWIEHRKLLGEAQDIIEQARDQSGSKINVDPVLVAIFGPDLDLPESGVENSSDWLTKALFGVSE